MPHSIFSEQEWTVLARELKLAPRQEAIARLILEGKPDKQIAQDLKLAVPTIRTHLTRLYRRLGITDRAELLTFIFAHFRQGCRRTPCHRQQ